MKKHNYYEDYIAGNISVTEGYASVTEILIHLFEEIYDDDDTLEEALLNTQLELDEHKDVREFYEHQQDMFAQRIAHNFMLANDYTYTSDGIYRKMGPADNLK